MYCAKVNVNLMVECNSNQKWNKGKCYLMVECNSNQKWNKGKC